MADTVKQIIIINMETPMSIGRLMAHCAHASVAVLLNKGEWIADVFTLNTIAEKGLRYWMKESFTKVVCKAWGKETMLAIKQEADLLKLPGSIIEEDGYITAVAIGPCESEKLNHFKSLPLL